MAANVDIETGDGLWRGECWCGGSRGAMLGFVRLLLLVLKDLAVISSSFWTASVDGDVGTSSLVWGL